MSKLSKYIAGVLFLCSLSGYSASQEAAVEQARGNVLEEIIVTAQKRTQSAQDIPVAIDAFTGDQIADSGVSDLEDLTHISTSFGINNGAGSAQLFIRGLGSNILGSGSYGSAAVYVDGSYIPRGYSLAAGAGELAFVDSLQVLKGAARLALRQKRHGRSVGDHHARSRYWRRIQWLREGNPRRLWGAQVFVGGGWWNL